MFDAPLLLFISFGHFILLTLTRVRALQIHGWASRAYSNPSCRPIELVSVVGLQQSEPGPTGSHETALKNFLSVSELALDRQRMLDFCPLCPCRSDRGPF